MRRGLSSFEGRGVGEFMFYVKGVMGLLLTFSSLDIDYIQVSIYLPPNRIRGRLSEN